MLDGGDASAAQSVSAIFLPRLAQRGAASERDRMGAKRSKRGRFAVAMAGFAAIASITFVGLAAASGAPRFHLRGTARIDAHVARSQGKLVLSGTVEDDMGAAVDHARVEIQISTPLDARATPTLLALAPMAPEACSDAWPAPAIEGTDRLVSSTDGAARFCIRLALPTGRYVARLEASGSGFVDGARIDLPVNLALEPVTLRFDPETTMLALDDESSTIEVVATTEDDGLTTAAANLPLALSNESGRALGDATTSGAGRARFIVPGVLFGAVGQGELRISFAGSVDDGASSYSMAVERRTHVELEVPQATGGRLPLAAAEEEIALRVVATATCGARGCVGTPSGTVEVRLGDAATSRIVGAASLAGGEARVVVTLPAPGDGEGDAPLTLNYLPDAPWFEATAPLRLTQPLHPSGAWDKIVLVLTGLGVVGWLGLGRLPRRWERERSPERTKIADRVASVEVVTADVAGTERWTGRVVDAHEGTGIAGVRVALERPGFERADVVVDAISDADGAFVLASAGVRPGDRLVAEGALHAAVQVPVPAFGDIRVTLVSRRRALLDRLVAWARRRGRPFDAQPEPTPGHVQRMARSGDAAKSWAEAVERAAYSGAPIDARGEAEVDRLAPEDPSPSRSAGKT
jgi:hypothetical protein